MASTGAAVKILKDTGEIYSRLFDHRAFLQGEQMLFVKEFEERRKDREVETLFSILEKATEIKETEIDHIQQNGDIYLPNVSDNICLAAKLCDKICDRVEKTNTDAAAELQQKRVKRRSDWDVFVADMQDERARCDQTFMNKEKSLRASFDERERNIKY